MDSQTYSLPCTTHSSGAQEQNYIVHFQLRKHCTVTCSPPSHPVEASSGKRKVHTTLPSCVAFIKPSILQIRYFKPSKIIEILTFHISVFVNMTNIIVKHYTVVYMCVEVMIYQSDRLPEIFMISEIPTMGDIKTHQMRE